MKVNWNMIATVKLNDRGKDLYEQYYRSFTAGPPKGNYRPDQVRESLWQLTQIFGRHMFIGYPIPFETMDFELETTS